MIFFLCVLWSAPHTPTNQEGGKTSTLISTQVAEEYRGEGECCKEMKGTRTPAEICKKNREMISATRLKGTKGLIRKRAPSKTCRKRSKRETRLLQDVVV